jgi:signal transduction histidine kinase
VACAALAASARSAAQRGRPAPVMRMRPLDSDAQSPRALRRRHPARHRETAGERVDTLSRRKQDFLSLLSHELRNPLSAISVALAVMRSRDSLETGQQARRVVERQVAHIARLVEDLVDTARIERGTLSLELQPVDLRDVLRTSVDMMRPSVAHRRQQFVWEPSPQPLPINGDRVRLQQVFSNLLLNASKYTPEGGQIELLTYRADSDVCVAVRDNGRGIPVEAIARVFEPFVRAARDESGLGIGLYVARTLVEGHGGEITVASTGAHTGATFTVRLPELTPLLQQLSG